MHPFPGEWVAIGCMCHAQAAHAFSAGIKCRHCSKEHDTFNKMRDKVQIWPVIEDSAEQGRNQRLKER